MEGGGTTFKAHSVGRPTVEFYDAAQLEVLVDGKPLCDVEALTIERTSESFVTVVYRRPGDAWKAWQAEPWAAMPKDLPGRFGLAGLSVRSSGLVAPWLLTRAVS